MNHNTEKTSVIDELDRTIVRILRDNGRISFRDLGEVVHLSPNATAERVRRLVELKIITGFSAKIDLSRLGKPLDAYIDVRLRPETSADRFERAALKIPGVVTFAILTGEFDCRVRVACEDQRDLMRVIEALRASGGAQGTNTTIICRETVSQARIEIGAATGSS